LIGFGGSFVVEADVEHSGTRTGKRERDEGCGLSRAGSGVYFERFSDFDVGINDVFLLKGGSHGVGIGDVKKVKNVANSLFAVIDGVFQGEFL